MESGITGRIYYIAKRYSRANNKYMKDYDKNKESKYIIEFDANYYMVVDNSGNGKTLENPRKKMNVNLVNNRKDFLKPARKPNFISQKIFSKDRAAIHNIKPVLNLNKPIYVGFCVLELSKYGMYDFHCNYFKKKFNTDFLFTDTDSLTYEVRTDDIYENICKEKELFVFSNDPNYSNYYDDRVTTQSARDVTGKSPKVL